MAISILNLMRISIPATTAIGPEYRTSHYTIEVDLSFKCNLKCFNCDRSCNQAPDNSNMTVSQIGKFVQESVANKREWYRIRILGGEPMLHPDIFEILERSYRL